MEIIIQVIWWIGLAGAVLLTLPILLSVVLVVRTLRDIAHLGERIEESAQGMAKNLEVGAELEALRPPAGSVRTQAEQLAGTVAGLAQRLAPITARLEDRGG